MKSFAVFFVVFIRPLTKRDSRVLVSNVCYFLLFSGGGVHEQQGFSTVGVQERNLFNTEHYHFRRTFCAGTEMKGSSQSFQRYEFRLSLSKRVVKYDLQSLSKGLSTDGDSYKRHLRNYFILVLTVKVLART